MLLFQYYFLEIKYRIIYLLLSLFNTFIFSYISFEEIFYILASPIIFVTSVVNFIYTNIGEIFFTSINFSFIVSLFLNLPIIYLHIWFFITPALFKYERYKFNLIIFNSLFLIFITFIFAYYIILPLTWNFFFHLEFHSTIISIHLQPKINEYFYNFYSSLIYIIIIFQLPILFYYLLSSKVMPLDLLILRRHLVMFISLVISSFISTGDIFNLLLITFFLYIFNEFIIFIFIFYKK